MSETSGLRLNPVIARLDDDHVVRATFLDNGNLTQAAEYGDLDLDMVIIEMEHVGFDFSALRITMQGLLSRRRIAADGLRPSVAPFVRLPPNASEMPDWMIKQTLDSGVYGLVLPKLETVEQAEAIVSAARYPAQRAWVRGDGGRRGYEPRRAARYWGLSVPEYMAAADVWPLNPAGNLLLIGLVESMCGVENLPAILDATQGIGAVYIGTGDLSADLGLSGDYRHPEVRAAIDEVLQQCRRRGVPCAFVVRSEGEARDQIARGVRIAVLGGDVASLATALGG